IWALKGDASIAGTATLSTGATATILLAATENNATIHTGTNALTTENVYINPGVNNRVLATTIDGLASAPVNAFSDPTTQMYTSNPALFIQDADLDVDAAQLRGTSNKVFTHLSYTWIDREDWVPYFGIGCSAEFGNSSNHNDNDTIVAETPPCSNGISFALSKWAVMIKCGVSF